MTRDEIIKLRRHTFLAIRAYFVASLEIDWARKLDSTQMQAAYMAYNAACKELDYNPAEEIPMQVRNSVNIAIDQLRLAIGGGNVGIANLRMIVTLLERAVTVAPADAQAGERSEGTGNGG